MMNNRIKHNYAVRVAVLMLAVALMGWLPSGCGQSSGENLKILYVGGTADRQFGRDTAGMSVSVRERMGAFETMLNDYFRSVTVIHAGDYKQEMSEQYDVTIMDGLPTPMAPKKYFTEDFNAPVVMIGELSSQLGRGIGLKTDWYCQCLGAEALHLRREHAIFNGPFTVAPTMANKPTPNLAFNYASFRDGVIPDSLPMWNVQTKGINTEKPAGGGPGDPGGPGAPGGSSRSVRAGLVIRPWGLEDSPEAEYISGGVSEKGLNAVAIGRHGNFLHWGFAASPNHMTEEGKKVLANAIVYIAQFKGKGVIARKYDENIATREYQEELKHLPALRNYQVRVKEEEAYNNAILEQQQKALEKQRKKEPLTEMEQALIRYQPQPIKSYEEYIDFYQQSFSGLYGMTVEAYAQWFDANRDYLYLNQDKKAFNPLVVDEDVKSLGIPNNDKRMLDEAIKMLEAGRETEKAKRILERYTIVDFATAQEWRKWYDTYNNKFFFTEAGGWVFLINSYEPGLNDYKARERNRAAARESEVAVMGETSNDEPVAIAAGVVTLPNGNRQVNINVKIHPGYQIYDYVAEPDPFIAAQVEVALPAGYTAKGEVKKPSGEFYSKSGTTVYKNRIVFSQEFTGSGTGELKCTVAYQCCDARVCFPPAEKTLVVSLP